MHILDKDRIGSLIVFIFCLSAWTFLDDMPSEAALFPRMIIGLATALSVIWGVSTFFKRTVPVEGSEDAEKKDHPFLDHPRNFFVFFGCCVAYAGLIDVVGYFTASALFVVGASLLLGYRRPIVVALTAIGFVCFIYLVFVVIFQRPLPVEFFQVQ